MLEIKKIGHPVLREQAREVDIEDMSLPGMFHDMVETLQEANGIGLASNQVGMLKKVFVYIIDEEPKILINPKIVWESEKRIEETEGCLSVPGIEVTISRAEKIKIEGHDLDGKKKTIESEGLLARVFQHEMDHLAGKLIIDRASEEDRKKAIKKMYKDDLR